MSEPGRFSKQPLQPRAITSVAKQALEDLRASIKKIEAWKGKPLPEDSRPYAALRLLQDVAETRRFTFEQRGTHDALRALELALDLREIALSLSGPVVTELRESIEKTTRGPLDPGEDRQPVQEQSALVVRAAYVRAGEHPTQLTHSGKKGPKPDILLHKDGMTFAVEVKRPMYMKNVSRSARDASEQIKNAGLTGGIVVDITDCLSPGDPRIAYDEVQRQRDVLRSIFFVDGQGWIAGHEHILMVCAMARPPWIMTTTGNASHAEAHSVSAGYKFGTSEEAHDHQCATWLLDQLSDGLDLMNAS